MFSSSRKPRTIQSQQREAAARRDHGSLSAWRRFLNPSVLGCFGLALTIAVWGYNYRLSLYHPHHGDTATRALAAKVWLDHRNVAAAAAPVAKYRIHPTTLRVDLKPRVFAPSFKWVLIALPTDGNRAFHSASLLPLRSPPSRSFSA